MLARIAETIEKREISTGELQGLTERLQSPDAKRIACVIVNPEIGGVQTDIRQTAEAIRDWAHTNSFA
jgi:dienelactone hydrolase